MSPKLGAMASWSQSRGGDGKVKRKVWSGIEVADTKMIRLSTWVVKLSVPKIGFVYVCVGLRLCCFDMVLE